MNSGVSSTPGLRSSLEVTSSTRGRAWFCSERLSSCRKASSITELRDRPFRAANAFASLRSASSIRTVVLRIAPAFMDDIYMSTRKVIGSSQIFHKFRKSVRYAVKIRFAPNPTPPGPAWETSDARRSARPIRTDRRANLGYSAPCPSLRSQWPDLRKCASGARCEHLSGARPKVRLRSSGQLERQDREPWRPTYPSK